MIHHPSISAGGDDINKLSKDIAQINKDIGEADLKANSNDPDERAFWRKRAESLQSEKLMLRNLMLECLLKEAEQIDLEAKQIDLELERVRKAADLEAKQLERKRQETSKIDGLIRLGKIGDNIMLFSVSKC